MTLRTGICDSTIWSMVNESVVNNKPINFTEAILDNARDTIVMCDSYEDCINEADELESALDEIGFNYNGEDLAAIDEKILTSNIKGVSICDKDWNEDYRDVNVDFDISVEDIIKFLKEKK